MVFSMNGKYNWLLIIALLALITGCTTTSDGVKKQPWKEQTAEAKAQLDKEIARRIAAGETMPEQVQNPPYAVAECVTPVPPQTVAALELGLRKNYVCDNSDAGKKVIAWRAWYCKDKEREQLCVLGRWDNGLPSWAGQLNRQETVSSGTMSAVFDRSHWQPESASQK